MHARLSRMTSIIKRPTERSKLCFEFYVTFLEDAIVCAQSPAKYDSGRIDQQRLQQIVPLLLLNLLTSCLYCVWLNVVCRYM